MAKRNFNGVQINQTVTIVEQAGKDIEDARNRLLVYGESGVELAADGKKPILGIALIEAGANDISGEESGKVATGDDVDIQIKDIGYVIAGDAIAKGDEITAGSDGKAKKAGDSDYVVGIALDAAAEDGDYCRVQINKYQKGTAAE